MASSYHFTHPPQVSAPLTPTLVMFCCFAPACSSTPLRPPVHYPSINLVVNIMYIQTVCENLNALYIVDQTDLHRFEVRMELYDCANARVIVSTPSISVSPPDATAKPMASSHHFTPHRQVSARLAPLCEALLSSSPLAGQKHPSLLCCLDLHVENIKIILP